MEEQTRPRAAEAASLPAGPDPAGFAEPFRSRVRGREKRALGDVFRLTRFGVNLCRIPPGSASSLRHAHTEQDEFVYVLEGHPVLVTNAGETPLAPGMCAGFPRNTGDAHSLVNRSARDVVVLEIGDRSPGDQVSYPDDGISAALAPDGHYTYRAADGTVIG